MSFYLFGDPDEKLRLKSFSGAARNGKMVLKIECEATDSYEFAYALERLACVQAGQKPPASPPPKAKQPKPLALPAPPLGLPKN